ncbi:uncharacterized protein BT62DRAFT_935309 [Guyanagaster necrorhizus]|uniref:Uncharacterized protein n=1 Tax=Guyanagaster necrorhizus TaxID=856835 RepID=A0A9P8APH6_9AGAR|nr:uncharacterized protein BT62DRAFT_935309 [Guyanagaster necrorhizus MCA 3950]KAG7442984.1 hypothetical protein BT62DRAFT_935309 [Guyanagaster necrorhizus MCA 3950]
MLFSHHQSSNLVVLLLSQLLRICVSLSYSCCLFTSMLHYYLPTGSIKQVYYIDSWTWYSCKHLWKIVYPLTRS